MAAIFITVRIDNVEEDADMQKFVSELEHTLQLTVLPYHTVSVDDWEVA